MTQRIIIAYNPRSSRHARIRQEVIEPARKMAGYTIGKFEVKPVPVDENAKLLAKILADGDLLIVAGGDGTATVGINAMMQTKAKATLGVLGYGNFNDFARMVKSKNLQQIVSDFEKNKVQKLYPMEAVLDGKVWRYAACYFTIGMFAESTEVFDAPKTRKSLRRGKKSLFYSIRTLACWYFSNKKKEFLGKDIRMDGVAMNRRKMSRNGRMNEVRGKQVSDVMFVNGETVARLMRGGDYWKNPEEIFVSFGRLKSFWRLVIFMIKSMLRLMPGHVAKSEVRINFPCSSEFEIQAEGEYAKVKAAELIVKKSSHGIEVVVA
ncbi:hypothetical protein IJI64_01490 [Candidatus Saccharibacteria bacterium]|nr:hypothetical protein [Candidatus Saccharibacteria bacterium]